MRFKTLITLAMVAVLAIALVACGDDDGGAGGGGGATGNATAKTGATAGETIELAADPSGQLKFDKTMITAAAGDITIRLTNDSSVPHDVGVRNADDKVLGQSDEITKSETTLKLSRVKAGTYTFFCSVPGHEAAGMKGTLTVK